VDWLLVGLGNPGPEYALHRHNVGFMALQRIAERHGFGSVKTRFKGMTVEGRIAGQRILALKPTTFMNRSGDAVAEAVRRGEGLQGDSNSRLTGGIEDLDDYFRCQIERKEDLQALFVPRFYFGCEADDPINAWAFNRRANPMGARLNAIFSSDIGHFDVPDMTAVVPEAYELVEHGLITELDFRDFMFANAVRFWGEVNPGFFKGTVVETQAGDVLARPAPRA